MSSPDLAFNPVLKKLLEKYSVPHFAYGEFNCIPQNIPWIVSNFTERNLFRVIEDLKRNPFSVEMADRYENILTRALKSYLQWQTD